MKARLDCEFCGNTIEIRDKHGNLRELKRQDFTRICPHGRMLWIDFNLEYWQEQRKRAAKSCTEMVSVRLPAAEKQQLQQRAAAAGVTVHEYIRQLVSVQ